PDISSPDALKRTLLAATSITYPDPALGGPSGIHFAKVLERLGIATEMQAKTVFPKTPGPGAIEEMVANGETEIGVGFLNRPVAGMGIVAPLRGDLEETIVFAAPIRASAKQPEACKALLDFLRTPEAVAAIKAQGMEPATP